MNIVFTPSGLKTSVDKKTSVLSAAQNAGVAIRSLCGGNGQCQQCWVTVADGKHAKFGIDSNKDNLTKLTSIEQDYIRHNPEYKNFRLACQAQVNADVVIDVPAASYEHKAYIAKKNKTIDYVCNPREVINASEKKGLTLYGAAIDIGTTTVAIYVHHLQTGNLVYQTSAMNPQIRYGEDLMSRISYVMLNKNGQEKLTNIIRQKIEQLLLQACDVLKIEPLQLPELTLVGNPVMHHLFLGLSPVTLGQAPFTPIISDWVEVMADSLGFDNLDKNTRFSFLPLIAGHIGADTVAAYLSASDKMETGTTLLVDIGTNAEILLAKDEKIYATSSPTGPAFEGAEISSGVRASIGAIERVRIEKKTLKVIYKQIGDDAWSNESGFKNLPVIGLCGSGIIEAVVELAKCGVIDKSGLFVQDNFNEHFIKIGSMVHFKLIESPKPIYITQKDIRSIQLAKAALSAGISLLMDHLNCKTLDKVLLAGAFGTYLDPFYVVELGLIPKAKPEQITAIGNAAGVGASMVLLDKTQKTKLIEKIKKIIKIESANHPDFQDYFVDAMQISASIINRQTMRKSVRNTKRGIG